MMTRLQYNGKVDMKGNVRANVIAQVLREVPGIGPTVSWILSPFSKLFEYRVSGTLKNPKAEPVYVPAKLLMMPLHPIQTLDELFSGGGYFPNPPPDN